MEPGAALPYIPFIHSGQDIIFFFYVLARVTGLFLVAPLLANQSVPMMTRIFLVVIMTMMLAMVLYPDYRGQSARFLISELGEDGAPSFLMLGITTLKEVAVGYCIGLAFVIIYEAMMLAGQVVGFMVGFSVSEVFDPLSNVSQGLVGQLFVLTASLLILALDLHHEFLRLLANSFTILPLGEYHMPYGLVEDFTRGSGRLFVYGMKIGALPFVISAIVTIGLGFMARVMPEMNVFVLGFPIKIFVGYYGLLLAITFMPLILQQAFVECENLANIILGHIASG